MANLNQQIKDFVLEEVKDQLSKAFQSSVYPIKSRLQDLCSELIAGSPAYSSLIDGELLGELGVPDIKNRLNSIINTIRNSLEVAYSPIIRKGNQLSGGLIINILKADFQDILQLAAASYNTEKGQQIPWLDWLLTQGDRIIVLGYDVVFTSTIVEQLRSRTGKALMKPGSGWRLDPAYSGTINDNFLTKAFDFDGVEDAIFKIVEEEITRFF